MCLHSADGICQILLLSVVWGSDRNISNLLTISGSSNLPSAMQLVWGKGHSVNEVLRQLVLFVFTKITSERETYYFSAMAFQLQLGCLV